MRYEFLVETYGTERIKVVSVWSEFRDEDLPVRPREGDPRGRSVHEQMVHQCVSENLWFINMLGIDVGAPLRPRGSPRSEEHTSELQSRPHLVCRLLLEKKKRQCNTIGASTHEIGRDYDRLGQIADCMEVYQLVLASGYEDYGKLECYMS